MPSDKPPACRQGSCLNLSVSYSARTGGGASLVGRPPAAGVSSIRFFSMQFSASDLSCHRVITRFFGSFPKNRTISLWYLATHRNFDWGLPAGAFVYAWHTAFLCWVSQRCTLRRRSEG